MQLPAQLQRALKGLPLDPQAAGAIAVAAVTAVALIVGAVLGTMPSAAPTAAPQGKKSVIQVVTADGASAGVCAIVGLRQEMVHYTDEDSLYYWELQPGEERITAWCPSLAAMSSGKRRLEGEATVENFDAPQVVKIVVQ
ncbi:hypothetical protein CKJ85_09020 [Corynebacterium sp. NML 150383]|uniref:hypothetical protein n=1 Tax=Corynebacterium sp. NML 150383 TaxID=2029400 RepID=UPI000BAA7B5E|nr:hypothetical protein [Corynebacterium sp. NML 150383]PAT03299.1 hypothetical protein CKJ85_09020 [Corynebacterium sp. NML 150383]